MLQTDRQTEREITFAKKQTKQTKYDYTTVHCAPL